MPSLNDPAILRELIMDHYQYPRHHGLTDEPGYEKVNMDSATCIDNIDVQAKVADGVIEDIRFDGEACAICTASTSMMSEMLSGKSLEEARYIIDQYMNMIYERDYDPEILEEAVAFQNTHKQANRIKCATLGWTAIGQLMDQAQGKEEKR